MYCISCSRFEKLMQDVMAADIPFYIETIGWFGKTAPCLEGWLLMPLKNLAFGVPLHTLDYFQMSANFGRKSCKQFYRAIKKWYEHKLLHLPTLADLKSLSNYTKRNTTLMACLGYWIAPIMGTDLTGRETSFSRIGTFGFPSCFLGDMQGEGSISEEWVMVGFILHP